METEAKVKNEMAIMGIEGDLKHMWDPDNKEETEHVKTTTIPSYLFVLRSTLTSFLIVIGRFSINALNFGIP